VPDRAGGVTGAGAGGGGGAAALPEPPRGWADLPFFATDWPALRDRLAGAPQPWQPAPGAVFRARDLTPPEAVRVVILGQDPYPAPGRATGLAFGFPAGTAPRDSLANILREVQADRGVARRDGDLAGWARQGVLLLNTVLTVPVGQTDGHRGWGWEGLAAQVLARALRRPCALVLWGARAQRAAAPVLAGLADPGRHLVLRAPHPSPLSAHRGFFGSRPFGRIDAWLAAQGAPPIDWGA
jgi:uracil-DNA glycosylase